MWTVSALFLQALTLSPNYQTVFTYTVPGGSPVTANVESGPIAVDSQQNIRRQGQSVVITGDSTVYAAVMIPGTIVKISHGVRYNNFNELVPVFHGEVTSGQQDLGGQTITLDLSDPSNLLTLPFISTFAPAAGTRRSQVIANAITTAIPGTTVRNTSSDLGLVGALNWTTNPMDVVNTLQKDIGAECFFMPDGSYVIRDLPVLDAPPVWSTNQAESAQRTRPMDQMFNTVVVQPGATDGTQTWTQQVVSITDTSSPLHSSKIGVRAYIYQDNTSISSQQAHAGGLAILNRFMGSSESLNLGLLVNPALEGSDVIGVIVPGINNEPAQSFRHFIDSFSLDLATGSMTLATRTTQLSLS